MAPPPAVSAVFSEKSVGPAKETFPSFRIAPPATALLLENVASASNEVVPLL